MNNLREEWEDTIAPEVSFLESLQFSESAPLVWPSTTVTLVATASDLDTGDSGIGEFEIHYREKVSGLNEWSDWNELNKQVLRVGEFANVLTTLDEAMFGHTYQFKFSAEDGAGNREETSTFVQFEKGKTGDVIEMDLDGIFGGVEFGLDTSSFSIEGVSLEVEVDTDGDLVLKFPLFRHTLQRRQSCVSRA